MEVKLKEFFSQIPSRPMTSRELERTIINRFNQKLEMFPPGIGPGDVIEEGIQRRWIREANGKYRVKP